MKLKITNPTLPIGEIGITRAFSDHLPKTDKLMKCLEFYRENHHFDRQIIVDGENYLHDGYCAYLVARMVGLERVKVLRVSERKEAVTGGTTPTVAKHEYKVGELVRIIANSSGHDFEDGEIVRLVSKVNGWKAEYLDGRKFWYVRESDIEPYTEAQSEPIKLYCVESFEPGEWLTEGKTYETNADGYITYDDGYKASWVNRPANFANGRPHSDFLVPLVKRPAKVGEWVYICRADCVPLNGDDEPLYRNGDVMKIIDVECDGEWSRFKDGTDLHDTEYVLSKDEYLVLDGYKGGAE